MIPRLNIRFDLRNPVFAGVSGQARYRAALEQARWADEQGFAVVSVSEHHGTDDGYLPSPLVMAAALAAVTSRVRIVVAAAVAPLHDPLRLAEDAAVVDNISGGRLDLVVGAGYVPAEFEMFGRELDDRVAAVVETVETLKAAWTGEPFEFRGRRARVTPVPHQQPRPRLGMGGNSIGAARRAARIADWFRAPNRRLYEAYLAELEALGKPAPVAVDPVPSGYVHVARDVDATWERVAPYVGHEMSTYAAMTAVGGVDGGPYSRGTVEEARDSGLLRVVTPDECLELARDVAATVGSLTFHPMLGGMPPDLGWESLGLLGSEVLPALRAEAGRGLAGS